ncbi:hypothetical protein BOTBODRAFT_25896 [Botryobasidium botryosum FD-172 SS1]|uniref:RBR-type E3 ubiquitin transferase n=1 Tax=Botryobasidium botryosum (strain FD-172 SS1) TaxID=930990 RepID=A0A067N0S7_BOTB1|nr:hypothetical protein BOTBODRAFT_25896 [Botryobasidium botryosum FD-172 SS1]
MSDESDYYMDDSASDNYYDDDDDEMVDGTQDSDRESSPASEGEASDDDAFGVELSAAALGKVKRKSYEVNFETLSDAAVDRLMNKEAEHVAGIFGLEPSTALLLLRHMAWNKERLIEKYMDNPEAVRKDAGILAAPPLAPTSSSSSAGVRRSARRANSVQPSAPPSTPFMCPVCCDDEPPNTYALACGHAFCSTCWETYLHTKVREEGEFTVRCMDSDCKLLADDAFIARVCSKEDSKRHHELVSRNFVGNSSQYKFCPLPGCSYTISCPSAASKSSLMTIVPTVKCPENHVFCFGCSLDQDHRPLICHVSKLWLKKCQDDSETANWIKSNTKECTKCQSTIEKNGGCNHMTCKKCKNEFCWVCMGPWAEHGNAWYTCNRYEEREGVEARDAQSKSRASLERYLQYYNRWANHEQSARLSLDLYSKTEKKMEEMQTTSNLTWIEVQFARKAVDEVFKCRMTLKWTYAMAFYLAKGNEKELFEDNQRDLEKAVEDLSELLESPIDPDNIPVLRQKMTDKTVYVLKRNEILLDDTAQGYLDGRWKWNADAAILNEAE